MIAAGQGAELVRWMRNLKILCQYAAAAEGKTYTLPRILDILSRPEFDALKQWVEWFGADVEGIQGEIDRMIEEAGKN